MELVNRQSGHTALGAAILVSVSCAALAAGIPARTSEPAGKFRDTPRAVWNVTGMWELLPVREGELTFPPEGDFAAYPVDPERPWRPYSWEAYNPEWRGVERAWARLRFELPDDFRGRRVEVRFAAVHTYSHLYVNGQHVLDNYDPFTPFGAEISELLRETGTNEILLGIEHYVDGMPMVWPVGAMYRYQRGIVGNVSLIARGDSYIDDLCVRTDFRRRRGAAVNSEQGNGKGTALGRGRLTARLELMTDTEGPVDATVRVRVVDAEGAEQLRLPEEDVRIDPGETRTVELSASLPDVRLWSPDDPVLYTAVAELIDPDTRAAIDARRERFGFREFTTDGIHLKLNGAKVRLKGIWGHTGEWVWGEPKEPVDIWQTLKTGHFNAARIHGQPLDPEFYDAADEVGYLLVDESGIFQRPQTNEALEHLRRWVRRDRNHPSVVIWSSSNEFRHWVVPRAPDSIDFLRRAYRAIRGEDPTRPIMHHGFGPLGAPEEDIINIHYPESDGLWQVPHSMYWPDNGTHNRNYPHFRWERDKPLAVGEHLLHSFTSYAALLGPAYFEGPQTMTAPNHYLGTAEGFRYAMDAYRLLDLAHVAPMAFRSSPDGKTIPNGYFDAIADIFRPVGAFFVEYHRNFRAGNDAHLTLAVYNETLAERSIEARVGTESGAGRKELLRQGLTIEPGDVVRVPVVVRPEPVRERTPGALVIELRHDGEVIFSSRGEISIYPNTRPAPIEGRVALYDPAGGIAGLLERFGVEVVQADDPTQVAGCDILAIGPNATDDAIAPYARTMARFVANGGRILAFAQEAPLRWLPVPLEAVRADELPGCTIAFPKVPEHPVLDGIGPDDLRFWWPDHWIAHASYQKPTAGNARVLVESGGPGGLDRSLLVEALHGKGAYILSQFAVPPELPDPAQERLLRNLVRYALEWRAQPLGGLRITADRQPVRDALAAVGVGQSDAEGRVWLIHLPGTERPEPAAVRDHLQAGGTVLLHQVTPETASYASEIAGTPVEITEAKPEPIAWLGGDPVGCGIGAFEILWTDADHHFSANRARHYVRCGRGAALTEPPALLVTQVGKGRVVIDQFGWEAEQADQAKAREYLSTLLTNCGVRLDVGSLVAYRVTGFRPIDLRPFCNMGFRDEVAGDGAGGWTDEGDNDMRNLPVGRQTLSGVPFGVIDPATNGGKSCITLTNTRRDGDEVIRSNLIGTTSAKDIPVEAFLSEIHLLLGCGLSPLYSGWAKPTVAQVIITYEDGTQQTFAIEHNRHVTDWRARPPEDLPAGKVAWVGANPRGDTVAIYQCVWTNPFPDRRVRSIGLHQGFQCPSKTPVFIAATGRTIELVE